MSNFVFKFDNHNIFSEDIYNKEFDYDLLKYIVQVSPNNIMENLLN